MDLNKPWRTYPIVSVDFESTSADAQTCEPVEVALVRYENGAIAERFSTLLRTAAPIPAEATAVHGIDDAMVANAPTLQEVAPELFRLADGAIPLAFNERFDRTIMHRYLSGDGVPLFDKSQQWLCSFAMAWSVDRFEPGQGRLKLTACCERRGINIIGAHRAESDALASGELFFTLMTGTKDDVTMSKVLRRVLELSAEQEKDRAAFLKKLRAEERLVWREYAVAALGMSADVVRYGAAVEGMTVLDFIAGVADTMLAKEKERFVK